MEVNGEQRLIGAYDNKGSFGELALMYNMPRAATIVATSNGSLWAMVSLICIVNVRSALWKSKECLLQLALPLVSTRQ